MNAGCGDTNKYKNKTKKKKGQVQFRRKIKQTSLSQQRDNELGMVQACNPSIWEMKAEGSQVQGQAILFCKILSPKKVKKGWRGNVEEKYKQGPLTRCEENTEGFHVACELIKPYV